MQADLVLLDNEDKIKALQKKGANIQKNVTDFAFNDIVKRYVTNGGYNDKKSLDENFDMLLQVIAITKANGRI